MKLLIVVLATLSSLMFLIDHLGDKFLAAREIRIRSKGNVSLAEPNPNQSLEIFQVRDGCYGVASGSPPKRLRLM